MTNPDPMANPHSSPPATPNKSPKKRSRSQDSSDPESASHNTKHARLCDASNVVRDIPLRPFSPARSRGSPMDALPTELLIQIFKLIPASVFSGLVTVLRLAGVCRDWKAVAFDLPTLWSGMTLRVDRAIPTALLQEWLQRSGRRALDLRLTISSSLDGSDPVRLVQHRAQQTMRTLLKELPRWRTLRMRAAALVPLLEALAPLTGCATMLEEVYIGAENDAAASHLGATLIMDDGRVVHRAPRGLFARYFVAPRLRLLDLGEARHVFTLLDLGSVASFPHLEALVVSWTALCSASSAALLAAALAHLPQLRELHLIGRVRANRPRDWAYRAPMVDEPYAMPSLEHIIFEGAELNDIVEFLEAITAQRLDEITWIDGLGRDLEDERYPVMMLSRQKAFPRLDTLTIDSFDDLDADRVKNIFGVTPSFHTYEFTGSPAFMSELRTIFSDNDPSELFGARGIQVVEAAGDISGEWAADFVGQIDAARREAQARRTTDPETLVPPSLAELRVTAYNCDELSEELEAELKDSVAHIEWKCENTQRDDHYIRLHRDRQV